MPGLLDRAPHWRVPLSRRHPTASDEGGNDEKPPMTAALGLALVGVAAPIAMTTLPALRTAIGPPLAADLLIGLLILAPASVAVTSALVGLSQIATSLRRNAPAEAEQAVLRVFATAVLFACAVVWAGWGWASALPRLSSLPAVAALGLAAAWAVLLAVVGRPLSSSARRRCATVLDIALLSVVLHVGGAAAAACYPIYLVVVFYAGFRFGERALIETAGLAVFGFAGVAVATEFWLQQPGLVLGLVGALIVPAAGLLAALRGRAAARVEAMAADAERKRSLTAIADALRPSLRMMRDGPTHPAARFLAGRIREAVELAAIETGQLRVSTEPFDIRVLAKESLGPLLAIGAEQGMTLRWRMDPRLPPCLRGPAQVLVRILDSLAGHLLQAADGGVRIAFDMVDRAHDRVKLCIRIDGDGNVGADPLGHRPGDDEDTAVWEQQALTLALVTRLIAMIGGELSIEGGPGPPSRFVVSLGLGIEQRPAEADLDLHGQTVLVVSDDEAFAGELTALLDRWQADAHWVGNADDVEGEITGLAAQASAVVIIDGRDHPLAGLAYADRIRTAGPGAPFILFVGDGSRIERLMQLDEGALDCLLPVPLTEGLLANAFRGLPLEIAAPADAPRPGDGEPVADDRVTSIAVHPKFVPEPSPALDVRAIEALRAAGGGDEFLHELIDGFRIDATELLHGMGEAITTGDAAAFSRGLMTLRRCAGHLGATRFSELLPSGLSITGAELSQRGPLHLQRLTEEVGQLTAALMALLPESEARRS